VMLPSKRAFPAGRMKYPGTGGEVRISGDLGS